MGEHGRTASGCATHRVGRLGCAYSFFNGRPVRTVSRGGARIPAAPLADGYAPSRGGSAAGKSGQKATATWREARTVPVDETYTTLCCAACGAAGSGRPQAPASVDGGGWNTCNAAGCGATRSVLTAPSGKRDGCWRGPGGGQRYATAPMIETRRATRRVRQQGRTSASFGTVL